MAAGSPVSGRADGYLSDPGLFSHAPRSEKAFCQITASTTGAGDYLSFCIPRKAVSCASTEECSGKTLRTGLLPIRSMDSLSVGVKLAALSSSQRVRTVQVKVADALFVPNRATAEIRHIGGLSGRDIPISAAWRAVSSSGLHGLKKKKATRCESTRDKIVSMCTYQVAGPQPY